MCAQAAGMEGSIPAYLHIRSKGSFSVHLRP